MNVHRLVGIVVLLLAIVGTAAGASVDLGKLAADWASPALGEPILVSNMSVKLSNLTLRFESGTAAELLVANEPIGIFFNGKGEFVYQSTDPIETPVAMFTGKKAGRDVKTSSDGTASIRGAFRQVYLRVGGIELPELKGSHGESLGAAYHEHREAFSNVRWIPPEHLFLRQALDEPNSMVAVAEISGSDEYAFVLDTIERKEESLYALIKISGSSRVDELKGALFPVAIAQQPVGRDREAFLQPRYLLVDLDYTLVEGEKDSMKLSTTETVVPRTHPLSVIRFDLISGDWDTDGDYRRLQVDSVTDADGNSIPYHFERDSLLVALPARIPANQPFTLRFEISGRLLYRPNNDSFWQLGTWPWFPQPDWNGQYFTMHSVVKVRKPWIAFAPGTTVSRREEEAFNVVENVVEQPIQYAVVHAGKYLVHEETFDDLTIRVATYAIKNERAMAQLASLANKIIRFYQPFLGPFPFKEYNIIEINDLGWGQAPPGTMFITKEAFNPLIDVENRLYSMGVNQRFAHEIAHQYFGHVVKMGSNEERWITEGFAEYCSGLVMKEIEGENGLKGLQRRWKADAKSSTDVAPIALAGRIVIPNDPQKAWEHRFELTYSKGAHVLTALRERVGDEKFLLLLRNLQGQYAWRFVTTRDVAAVMQRIDPGKDYARFFSSYVWGTEMP